MLQSARQIGAVTARGVEVIERPCNQQIRIGVEIAREFFALVAQIGLDLELHIVVIVKIAARPRRTLGTAELFRHDFIRLVGNVAHHAGHRQAMLA